MAKPDKSTTKPPIIDVNDSDQVIRLVLCAVFTVTWIARGKTLDPDSVEAMADYADALMHAASKQRSS
jgi:hypothetical protein